MKIIWIHDSFVFFSFLSSFHFSFFLSFFFLFILYAWVFSLYICTICMPSACRGQKVHNISCNWSYRWLRAAIWILRTESGSSGKVAHVLNYWAIYLACLHAPDHSSPPCIPTTFSLLSLNVLFSHVRPPAWFSFSLLWQHNLQK